MSEILKNNTVSSSDQPNHNMGDGREMALPPQARRALAEAQARRAQKEAAQQNQPPEEGGRGGPDPARFGDWEINGRAIDF